MSAYDEGFTAKQEGKSLSENPYSEIDGALSIQWADGWRDLNHHLCARDEALESIGWFGPRS